MIGHGSGLRSRFRVRVDARVRPSGVDTVGSRRPVIFVARVISRSRSSTQFVLTFREAGEPLFLCGTPSRAAVRPRSTPTEATHARPVASRSPHHPEHSAAHLRDVVGSAAAPPFFFRPGPPARARIVVMIAIPPPPPARTATGWDWPVPNDPSTLTSYSSGPSVPLGRSKHSSTPTSTLRPEALRRGVEGGHAAKVVRPLVLPLPGPTGRSHIFHPPGRRPGPNGPDRPFVPHLGPWSPRTGARLRHALGRRSAS